MTAIEVSLFNQGRFMIFSRGKRCATDFLTPSGKKLPLKNLKSSIFPRLKFEKNLYCQLKDEYKSYKQLLLNLTIFYTVSQKKVWLAASGAKIANFHFTILQIFCDYVIQYYIFDFLNFWVWEKKSFRKVRKVKKFEQPQTNTFWIISKKRQGGVPETSAPTCFCSLFWVRHFFWSLIWYTKFFIFIFYHI